MAYVTVAIIPDEDELTLDAARVEVYGPFETEQEALADQAKLDQMVGFAAKTVVREIREPEEDLGEDE